MIQVKIGNIFDSNTETLVNTVNCVGVMGKGIAAEFKKQFPDMFVAYKKLCGAKLVKLGEPYLYRDLLGNSIVNFPTKNHWRSPSRLGDIEAGLDHFINHYEEWEITSVAFPPLGCGNGGLEWVDVGPLMYEKLTVLKVPVELYAPYGTLKSQLTEQFLKRNLASQDKIGVYYERIRDEWLAILEVVYQLSQQQYANPVGRTIFQKISYVMTELGVHTGFSFSKGSYGPFSPELKNALTILANANLVEEKQLGKMTAIFASENYQEKRGVLFSRIRRYERQINKTVDLFSRIKSTDQAEEVSSIIYATKFLKDEQNLNLVSEQDVFDYILDWKKSWQENGRPENLATGIRNLQMLGWVKLKYSQTLPAEEF